MNQQTDDPKANTSVFLFFAKALTEHSDNNTDFLRISTNYKF